MVAAKEFSATAGALFQNWNFLANSIYDPFQAFGTKHARGFDQLLGSSGPYLHFLVRNARITVDVTQKASEAALVYVVAQHDAPSAIVAIENAMEGARTTTAWAHREAVKMTRLVVDANMANLLAVKDIQADVANRGSFGAIPTNLVYFGLGIIQPTTAQLNATLFVKIEYDLDVMTPHILPVSAG
jgi:hypothetical protein